MSSTDEENDNVEAIKERIQKLTSRLQELSGGAINRAAEATLSSQPPQLLKVGEEVASFRTARSNSPSNNSTNALQVLEKNNKELVNMCNDLEEELEKEQEEYDSLFQMYSAAVKSHEEERERWKTEMEELRRQHASTSTSGGIATTSSPSSDSGGEEQKGKEVGSHEFQDELEVKTFLLAKEKEVVAHLQETIDELRREMEKMKEKQYLREKFIGENYEAVIEQLREDRQRMQQKLREQNISQDLRDHSRTLSTHSSTHKGEEKGRKEGGQDQSQGSGGEVYYHSPGSADENEDGVIVEIKDKEFPFISGKDSVSAFIMAPLQRVEREAYHAIISQLQTEVLELRKEAFLLPPICSRKLVNNGENRQSHSRAVVSLVSGTQEIEFAKKELLETKRTIPECCVKVLDFTNPISRKKSTCAMFAMKS